MGVVFCKVSGSDRYKIFCTGIVQEQTIKQRHQPNKL